MFTPALTAFGTQFTSSPSPSLSLPATAPTTLVQAVRRDDSSEVLTNAQTCGYTSGAWSSAVTCGSQQSCTYYSSPYSAPNFGCCSNGSGCGYVSTCLDYRAQGNFNTGAGVAIAGANFLCGSILPYCSTLLLYDNLRRKRRNCCLDHDLIGSTNYNNDNGSKFNIHVYHFIKCVELWKQRTDLIYRLSAIDSGVVSGASSTIVDPSATSTNHSSPNSLSQTSQIGIAIGVSIGVCVLLASIAFLFFRHRKAKADRRWLEQPSQTFPTYLHHMDGTKAQPFDYRSDSFRTKLSGKSAGEGEAAYELSSTGRTHELSAGDR
ncbi:hypothetical protein KCU77_g6885, partial [Aureobasidium melanogenum]